MRTTPPSTRLDSVLLVTLLAGCLVALLSFGVRGAFCLLTEPLTR